MWPSDLTHQDGFFAPHLKHSSLRAKLLQPHFSHSQSSALTEHEKKLPCVLLEAPSSRAIPASHPQPQATKKVPVPNYPTPVFCPSWLKRLQTSRNFRHQPNPHHATPYESTHAMPLRKASKQRGARFGRRGYNIWTLGRRRIRMQDALPCHHAFQSYPHATETPTMLPPPPTSGHDWSRHSAPVAARPAGHYWQLRDPDEQ